MGRIWIPGGGGSADLDVITAGADDVLAPKVIVGPDGEPLTGTLALSGNANTVDVRKGKTFYSNNAKSKLTGTMTELGAKTYTPGTANQVIAANQFLAGAQTMKGDGNLIADNIVYGKSIFGVSGKVRRYTNKSYGAQSISGSMNFEHARFSGTIYLPYIKLSLGFQPSAIIVYGNGEERHVSTSMYGQWVVIKRLNSVSDDCVLYVLKRKDFSSSSLIIPVASDAWKYNIEISGYQ